MYFKKINNTTLIYFSMTKKSTQIRNLRTGKPKNPSVTSNRRRKGLDLETNYAIMLQLYYINKKEASMKKHVKCEKLFSAKSIPAAPKPSYSISAKIHSFVSDSLLLLKKLRPGIAMVAE